VTRDLLGHRSCLVLALVLAGLGAWAPSGWARVWSPSLAGGYSKISGVGSIGGSWAARANLLAVIDPAIALGPEVGYYGSRPMPAVGGGTARPYVLCGGLEVRSRGYTGHLRPTFFGGIGAYSPHFDGLTKSSARFGYNLGGGWSLGTSPRLFTLEGRWHSFRRAGGGSFHYASVLAGVAWH
jgi:hypothetical protein